MSEELELHRILRNAQLAGYLETICQQLELTSSQYELAEQRYQAVGRCLQEAGDAMLRSAEIYPQGSICLETTVKPVGRTEYDLDLVCLLELGHTDCSPTELKTLVGDRLRESHRYRQILEEKPRCWRINYANEFHLDVTPAIPNPACSSNGELVPDKKLQTWKPTNPRGYRAWFEAKANIAPAMFGGKELVAAARAEIEALPGPTKFKGILRRCVQLCKRHRDLRFMGENSDLAPISVIITTLAARSYQYCALNRPYESELELLIDVVVTMPRFVEQVQTEHGIQYAVWNKTTDGENFAEKWNQKPELARAFFDWNQAAGQELGNLGTLAGTHNVRRSLSHAFGEEPVGRTFDVIGERVNAARRSANLRVAPAAGVVTSPTVGSRVRSNTFYGRDWPSR